MPQKSKKIKNKKPSRYGSSELTIKKLFFRVREKEILTCFSLIKFLKKLISKTTGGLDTKYLIEILTLCILERVFLLYVSTNNLTITRSSNIFNKRVFLLYASIVKTHHSRCPLTNVANQMPAQDTSTINIKVVVSCMYPFYI